MITIVPADLSNTRHGETVLSLLDMYAHDPMGGGQGLSDYAKTHLISALTKRENVYIFLAFVTDQPVGLILCMEAFSTFSCRPILNIHDLVVHPEYRGQGLSTLLLKASQELALKKDCCKLTLEVLEGNKVAKEAYRKFGFKGYQLDPEMGNALFLEKKLPSI